TWSLPSQTGGVSIAGYRIYVETSASTWVQEPTNCDGINNFTVIAQRTCSIPVEVLRAPPFNLTTGLSIRAKIVAFNVIGDSSESTIGSGGLMPIPPYVPTAPLSLTRNNSQTDQTQVAFTWQLPADNGRRPILDYTIQWN
ncbi:MAG: hypothetical protein ACK55Z_29160, partial [bacterium]